MCAMDAKGALGEVEANLVALNEEFHLLYIPELVQRKIMGSEVPGSIHLREISIGPNTCD